MIRLCVNVKIDVFQEFSKENFERQVGVKHYTDTRYDRYRNNFSIEQSFMGMNFSYYVGYQHNTEKKAQQYALVIEYNPNKCYPVDTFQKILKTFFMGNFEVKSCDIALDMDINIQDLIIDKGQKATWSEFGKGNADNRTKYYGQGSGRVKIYNKAIEQGIKGRDWTRYEVTYKVKLKRSEINYNSMIEVMNEQIPTIYTIQNKFIIDPTLRAVHFAVMNGYNVNELSRAYKDKIKNEIQQERIQIDNKKIKECLREYILLYEDWVDNKIIINDNTVHKTTKR
jgi:hypothetical protein